MTVGLDAGEGGAPAPDEHPAHNAIVTNKEASSRTPITVPPPPAAYGLPDSWCRSPKDGLPGGVAADGPVAGAVDRDIVGKHDRLRRVIDRDRGQGEAGPTDVSHGQHEPAVWRPSRDRVGRQIAVLAHQRTEPFRGQEDTRIRSIGPLDDHASTVRKHSPVPQR